MIPQAEFFGRAVYVTSGVDVTLNHRRARVWTINATTTINALLPAIDIWMKPGGPYYYVINPSGHDIEVMDDDKTVLGTIAGGEVATIHLVSTATLAGTWALRIGDPTATKVAALPHNGHIHGGPATNTTLFKFTVSSATWSTLTAAATGRSDGAGFVLGEDGYWVGDYPSGADSAILERLRAGSWSAQTSAPHQAGRTCGSSLQGCGYLISGDAVENVAEYRPDAWTTKQGIPLIRSRAAAIGLVDRVYLISGDPTLTPNMKYDPVTDTWVTIASYPSGQRRDLSAFGVADQIYSCGGSDGSLNFDNVDRYDLVTDAWLARAVLSQGKRIAGATFATLGRGWYCGGNDNGGSPTATVTQYSPSSNAWSSVGDMPATKTSIANHGVVLP